MDEERLIEISTEFFRNDGPLSRMAFVSSLREYEINELCVCIHKSKYAGLNFYDACVCFFRDCLTRNNITLADVMGEEIDEAKSAASSISYLDNLLSLDIGSKSRR